MASRQGRGRVFLNQTKNHWVENGGCLPEHYLISAGEKSLEDAGIRSGTVSVGRNSNEADNAVDVWYVG
jgi:hypothetical protein